MEAVRVLESCWEIARCSLRAFAFDRRVLPRPNRRHPSTRLSAPSPARRPTGRPVRARRRASWASVRDESAGPATEPGSPPGTSRGARPAPDVRGPRAGGTGATVARARSRASATGAAPCPAVPPPEVLVEPVSPESPERARGEKVAVELAGPVSPVLVAEDWLVVAPESPLRAEGLISARTAPPSPPPKSARACWPDPTVPTAWGPAVVLEAAPA